VGLVLLKRFLTALSQNLSVIFGAWECSSQVPKIIKRFLRGVRGELFSKRVPARLFTKRAAANSDLYQERFCKKGDY
ncbi:MAG: hypothetical protein IJ172_10190, partial [Ruminococcus sp.]|nr:hypothetical protein [Ruminococcus sp.]